MWEFVDLNRWCLVDSKAVAGSKTKEGWICAIYIESKISGKGPFSFTKHPNHVYVYTLQYTMIWVSGCL